MAKNQVAPFFPDTVHLENGTLKTVVSSTLCFIVFKCFLMLCIFAGERSLMDNTEDITEADSNDITEQ